MIIIPLTIKTRKSQFQKKSKEISYVWVNYTNTDCLVTTLDNSNLRVIYQQTSRGFRDIYYRVVKSNINQILYYTSVRREERPKLLHQQRMTCNQSICSTKSIIFFFQVVQIDLKLKMLYSLLLRK